MNSCHHSTDYPSCTKNLMVPGSLLFPTNALRNSFHHYLLLALKPYSHYKFLFILIVFITIQELIAFGLSITLLKYWTGYIKLIRPQELDDLIVMILLHYNYTNIPHNALKNNIRNLVGEAFKIRGAKYLFVNRNGKAHWSLEPASSTACVSVSKSKLVEWTEYLIDNVYIKVGNNVYRQTIGIPMGTNGAPQLANLFLFHYEYSYMKNLMRDNLCMAKRFSDTVRYIDHLLTLNNSNFEEEIPNTYPPELTLKRTSESDFGTEIV